VDDFNNNAGLNNREIFDNSQSQKLSHEQIEELKGSGGTGEAVVKALCENNSSFEKKTDLSKLKYIKRKKDKFLKRFTALEPTIRTMCEFYTDKFNLKVRDLRVDTLSLMLCSANVHANSRLLVVDDVQGLLLAAVASRLDGDRAEILAFYGGPEPVHTVVNYMNLNKRQRQAIKHLSWAHFSSANNNFDDDEQQQQQQQQERFAKMKNQRRRESAMQRVQKLSAARESLINGGPFDG
jgi:tRNA (adenine-N(1)-)-methyltransferase non-catalytic subunit